MEEIGLEQICTRKKWRSFYVPFSAFIASIGGILFGYDIGIVSGALLQLKEIFSLSSLQQELVVSGVLFGAFFSSFFGGNIVDSWGRKTGIVISCGLFTLGALILCLSINFCMLIIGRFIVGIAVSLSVTAECTYISEISPPKSRGMMVSLNEVGITVGFLLAYLMNFLFISVHNGWKYMFGAAMIPAILQALGVVLMPNSHHYLLIKGETDKARKVLKNLRNSDVVEEEIKSIVASIDEQKSLRYVDLFSSVMKERMILAMTLVFLQQFSGNANVLYYATTIFQHFGYNSDTAATLVSVSLGLVKVLSTTLALLLIDKVGRRFLLLTGCILMATSIIILGIVGTVQDSSNKFHSMNREMQQNVTSLPSEKNESLAENPLPMTFKQSNFLDTNSSNYDKQLSFNSTTGNFPEVMSTKVISVISLMTFVFAYSISYGPVTWLVLSEIFPGSLRGRAVSVASCVNWGSNIIVSFTFLDVVNSFGIGPTFVTYGIISLVAALFVFFCVPETKSRTLEEINDTLSKGILRNDWKKWLCLS